MAERRMFSNKIIDSDAFLDMPASSQNLYFHLGMRADDDGFVNNPKNITKSINASDDDLKILLSKKFIIGFESGVIVIKHWRIHNYIQKDRYNGTTYHEEMARLNIDKNNGYTMDTDCIQVGYTGKDRLGKDRLGKDRLGKDRLGKSKVTILCQDDTIEIINYLNLKAHTNYKTTTPKTINLITLRSKEGFTLDDFKKVIDIKTSQWLNDKKMSPYLRPETLFGTKFEAYLNEQQIIDVDCWADSEVIDEA